MSIRYVISIVALILVSVMVFNWQGKHIRTLKWNEVKLFNIAVSSDDKVLYAFDYMTGNLAKAKQ